MEIDSLLVEFSTLKPIQKEEDCVYEFCETKLYRRSKKERELLLKIRKL